MAQRRKSQKTSASSSAVSRDLINHPTVVALTSALDTLKDELSSSDIKDALSQGGVNAFDHETFTHSMKKHKSYECCVSIAQFAHFSWTHPAIPPNMGFLSQVVL